jgi:hypothetical protein
MAASAGVTPSFFWIASVKLTPPPWTVPVTRTFLLKILISELIEPKSIIKVGISLFS